MVSQEILKLREIETSIKTFPELKAEIIDTNRCTYCLFCLEYCRRENREAIFLEGEKLAYNEDLCTKCGSCYVICPILTEVDSLLKSAYAYDSSEIGHFLRITSAVTRDREIKKKCLDGGVVTSLLVYLMDKGLVDGAVLSSSMDQWENAPIIASSREEILDSTGFRFGVAGILTFLRRMHRQEPYRYKSLAMVGVPCQIQTVRRMQHNNTAPSNKVEYCIGLMCYENFTAGNLKKDAFKKIVGAPIEEVESINMRDDLVITLKNGNVKRIDLDDFSRLVNASCISCTDYSARFADISVGGLGSDQGFNTVIIRTEKGKEIFEDAVRKGYIAEWGSIFDRSKEVFDLEKHLMAELASKTRRKRALAERSGRVIAITH